MILRPGRSFALLLPILLAGAVSPAAQASFVLTSPPLVAQTQGSSRIVAKIRQYLDQVGSRYTKVSDTTWTVPYRGKSFKQYEVFVTTVPNSDLVVMGVIIAPKNKLKPSQDLYLKLLKYNNEADSVKVGIDGDGDLFLRSDVNGRTMDAQEFKEMLEQVAAATDELHGQIKTSLMPN